MSEETLFHAALDKSNPIARAAFLDGACVGKPELREAVEALLAAHEASGAFLNAPDDAINSASGGPATEATGIHTPRPDGDPAPGTATVEFHSDAKPNFLIAGRYTLQEKIGEGGMGEVWVAKQSEPVKRKVALKLIKQGMDSRAVLQRFEQERQALAMMDHPNIAKVLDAGLTPNGQPFFVMELVNGLPLNKFCDEARLTTKDRLELFVTICQAVQHAHQKGIVHRDLKPANILITIIDGKPVPKVIDFGVAKATAGKLTDESLSTQFGAIVGTLEYMSPEQAGFSGEDIDTRADIYSLGVILYELLTGLRPIDARRLKKAALTEMIRIIQEEEPSKPSTRLSTDESAPSMAALRQVEPRKLMALLRGELDWVVMKCLEKHRDRRYETASGLARDIQRYLADEAVEARPPSAGYRFQKFVRRNKGQVIAASLVVLTLIGGIIGTSIGLVRADRARQAEAAQRKIAVEEKTKAEASEALAKEQRTRAESREQQAIAAVKRFRDAVANNPELKNNPALESLRKTLLKEPLEFFRNLRDRLQADKDTRPESLDRLADAAFELGALTDEIGDKADAIRAYEESLAIRERLARENPAATHFASDVAASHASIGVLLSETGKPARAMAAYEQARGIFERLARENPTVAELQSDLALTHNSIGTLLRDTGNATAAMTAYERGRQIFERLARENTSVNKFQCSLAVSHLTIGVLLSKTGKPADALTAYEQARAIQERLVRENPSITQFQRDLAICRENIGMLLRETGKPAEALAAYEQAAEIWLRLTRENPTVTQFQHALAATHGNIGILLHDTGKPAEALVANEQARAIWQRLARENSSVTVFQLGLAESHHTIGNLLSATGKWAEALAAHAQARAIFERLARENPTVTAFQCDLASSHQSTGLLLIDTGKQAEALAEFEQALVIQERLARENPTVIEFKSDLAISHDSVGSVLRDIGNPAGALAAYERARAIRERLAREHPELPDYASGLGGTLNNLALVDLDAKRFAEARDRLREAITWQKKALATNPRHPNYRLFLSKHYGNLLTAALGLHDDALVAEVEQGLAELAASDPMLKALDVRLAGVLGGSDPKDNTERVALAQRAYDTKKYALATRLWDEALKSNPKIAESRNPQHRYNAACSAALAGCGKGKDDPAPDDAARAKLRSQALDWLNAELVAWSHLVESGPPQAKPFIVQTLKHWQDDPDVAGIRDEDKLAKLPEAERLAWKGLWADLDALLKKVEKPAS